MWDMEYQFRKELWEESQDELLEAENNAVISELNRAYNRKGYTASDYENYNIEN